jgi:hypothetical protein
MSRNITVNIVLAYSLQLFRRWPLCSRHVDCCSRVCVFQVAIEGNIAAGKSTLLDSLRLTSFAQVIAEPVDKWQSVIEGDDGNIMVRCITQAAFPSDCSC